jgi:hypothetical protein
LVWEAYHGTELAILSSVPNGKRGEPKAKARRDTVPLIEPSAKTLDLHRLAMGNPEKGVMFPTRTATPLSLHNVLNDYILPVLERGGQCGKGESAHRQ